MPTPIGRILTDLAQADPGRPMVTCGDVTVSRGELDSRANRLARAYEQLGVGQGDFVTIALPNSVDFIAACFAVWKLGAVPQPVSAKLPGRELQAILGLAQPSLVVGVDAAQAEGRRAVPIGFEPDPSLSDEPIEPVRVPPAWKAPTSGGSTGRPKLIVAGQQGEMEPALGAAFGMPENGVQLVPGPLYHNAPFTFTMLGLHLGEHIVVLPKFDPVAALDAIDRHRVQFVNFVPTMMLRILRVLQEHPGRYDIGSLEVVWHMAAPCPAWLKQAWIDLVGAERLMELYGGTEGQATTVITGVEWLAHRGSVGRPVVGEMKIVGPDGSELPRGELGEVYMRGPVGAPPSYRYIGAEARTLDGWESLGDLGWMDDDGYLFLSDRRIDLILSGGANIYPAEVEAALQEHPLVETCAVVGLPDEDLGERLHAVVQATGPLDEATLRSFLADRLVRYKVPRSFRFVTEPVRDDAGKVRRSALRDEEAKLVGDAR